MRCWGSIHYWSWSVATTTDPVPLNLHCDCGAVERTQAAPPTSHPQQRDLLWRATDDWGQLRWVIVDEFDRRVALCIGPDAREDAEHIANLHNAALAQRDTHR